MIISCANGTIIKLQNDAIILPNCVASRPRPLFQLGRTTHSRTAYYDISFMYL